jgi:hypothetical protein
MEEISFHRERKYLILTSFARLNFLCCRLLEVKAWKGKQTFSDTLFANKEIEKWKFSPPSFCYRFCYKLRRWPRIGSGWVFQVFSSGDLKWNVVPSSVRIAVDVLFKLPQRSKSSFKVFTGSFLVKIKSIRLRSTILHNSMILHLINSEKVLVSAWFCLKTPAPS